MNTTEFLLTLLGETDGAGWYCIVGLKEGTNPKTAFLDSIDAAAATALELSEQKYNAYFACATFATKEQGRKTPNVRAIKSLYLDIDCGVGKPYEDQQAGAAALLKFIDETGLSVPMIVSSGYGLHVYWVFEAPLSYSEWKPLAERLKALCKERGLMIDSSVTADAARILRVLGTKNYKAGAEQDVEVWLEAEPFLIDEFRQKLGITILLSEAPDYIKNAGLTPLMQSLSDDRQKRFQTILERSLTHEGCKQLEHIIEEQAAMDYNLWRAGLSIARNCVDWDVAIHAVSRDHPGYDFETTLRKCEDLVDKPYRCDTFESLRPGGCKHCPNKGKIKSPIMLGLEIAVSSEQELVELAEDGEAVEYKLPPLPSPYFFGKSGAVYCQANNEEDAGPEMVYEHSLYLVKRMTDFRRGDLVLARVHLPRERAREFIIPVASMTSKDELRKVLSANGVISAGKSLDKVMWYLIVLAKNQQITLDTEVLHNQMGWTEGDGSFVLGTQEVGVSETKYSPPSEATESVASLIHPKGSLAEWKRVMKTYAVPGAEPYAFAWFSAWGAPLMKFTGYNGALVSLVSPFSGTGKTTIMKAINSVYGHPDKLLSVESDTYAHKIYRLGVLNNLPATIDEVTNIALDPLSKLVYALTQGRGPGRMQSQANLERKNDTIWGLIGVCTSNSSLVDKLSAGKATANGELMRVLEYRIDGTSRLSKAEAYELFEVAMMENYGVAGPVFIEYVVRNREEVLRRVRDMQEFLDRSLSLESRERFWSAMMAASFTGARIAYELDLHEVPVAPVLKWVGDSLIHTLRNTTKEAVVEWGDVLGEFLNENTDSLLVIDGEKDNRSALDPMVYMMPKRKLLIRLEPDTHKLYVASREFKEFCSKRQIMVKDVLHDFKERKVFLGDSKKRMGKGTNLDAPAIRVYEFTSRGEDFFGLEGLIKKE